MKVHRSRLTRLLAIPLIAAVSLAACGDDDDAASGDGGGGSCETQGVSADTIKLGGHSTSTGQLASVYGPAMAAARARLELANAEGGVNGRTFEFVDADAGTDAQVDQQSARRLVQQDKVFGIIEFSLLSGAADFYGQEGIPVVGLTTSDAWGNYENMFPPMGYTAIPAFGTSWPEFLASVGVTNLGIISTVNQSSTQAAHGSAEGAREIDLEVGFLTADIPLEGTDYTADVQAMKDAGVDGVITTMQLPLSVAFQKAARAQGLDATILNAQAYDHAALEKDADAFEGIYTITPFAPIELELPVHEALLSAFEEHAPGTTVSLLSVLGWISADVFVEALTELGDCPTWEAFNEAVNGWDDYTADGLIVPADFSERGVDRPAQVCGYVSKVVDAAFVPESEEPFCAGVVGL